MASSTTGKQDSVETGGGVSNPTGKRVVGISSQAESRRESKTVDAEPSGMDLADRGAASPGSSSSRWWIGVAVGLVLAFPFGWLLSYAATLPFFLGPFFFALFGLVIGAVIHRVASPGRPYAPGVLVIGTTLIVLLIMSITIINESRDFPGEMAAQAAKRTRTLEGRTIYEYRADVSAGARRFLEVKYPPGGTLGYVRWIVTSGEVAPGEIEGVKRRLSPQQGGIIWSIRVVLSFALLGFGIGSLTLNLRLRDEPLIREIDAKRLGRSVDS